ncbi:MAG: hypothetical protein AB7H71_15395 [Alphaproteobacteria bacterium]
MKTGLENVAISPEQAFAAMFVFLSEYYQRTNGTAVLADVLGDIQPIQSDGMPADPAAWEDWLAAIRAVLSDAQAKR